MVHKQNLREISDVDLTSTVWFSLCMMTPDFINSKCRKELSKAIRDSHTNSKQICPGRLPLEIYPEQSDVRDWWKTMQTHKGSYFCFREIFIVVIVVEMQLLLVVLFKYITFIHKHCWKYVEKSTIPWDALFHMAAQSKCILHINPVTLISTDLWRHLFCS